MRHLIKQWILAVPLLRKLVYEWGWGIRVPISTVLLNYLCQIVLRQNKGCPYPVHFTSKVACPEKLKFHGNPQDPLTSLAISTGCYLQAGNGIHIGEGTIWAPHVAIISANHDMNNPDKSWLSGPPVKIGRNCWIGVNAVILPGVVLGDHVVVGAGAIVVKSYPAGHVTLVGNPAAPKSSRPNQVEDAEHSL